jgi:hypothetical protein
LITAGYGKQLSESGHELSSRSLPLDVGLTLRFQTKSLHRGSRPFSARTGLLRRNKQRLYSVALEAFTILGNRTVKVEPPLGSLSTVMSPRII